MAAKSLHIIGFGSVGYAMYKLLQKIVPAGKLPEISAVSFWAPEIKEARTEGILTFNPSPFFARDNLTSLLDKVGCFKRYGFPILYALSCKTANLATGL